MNNKWLIQHIGCWLLMVLSACAFAKEPQKKTINDLNLFEQAVQLSEKGKWPSAEKIFREISQRNPSWPEPKNNLAVALHQAGKLEQAQQALEDAVTSLPSFKTAQSNRQKLFDYSATLAYYRAVGIDEKPGLPKLEILKAVEGTSKIVTRLAPAVPRGNTEKSDVIVGQIQQSLEQWAKSWSDSNVKQYLAAYSNTFKPSDPAKNYAQWRKNRRDKLRYTKIDQVLLEDIRVYLDSNNQQALAEFEQLYRSNKYQDRVLKQLQLVYEGDRWLIASERVIQPLN